MHTKSKTAYKAWVTAGRPRSSDNPIRMVYKTAKANLRSLMRRERVQQRNAVLRELDLSVPVTRLSCSGI